MAKTSTNLETQIGGETSQSKKTQKELFNVLAGIDDRLRPNRSCLWDLQKLWLDSNKPVQVSLLPFEVFDNYYDQMSFLDEPKADRFGEGDREPYFLLNQAWGILNNGEFVYCMLKKGMDNLVTEPKTWTLP